MLAGLLAVGAVAGGGGGGGSGGDDDALSPGQGGTGRSAESDDPVAPIAGAGGGSGGSAGASATDASTVATPDAAPTGDTVYIPDVADSAYSLDWGGLSPEEQLILELVNAARLDPRGEAADQGVSLASGVSSAPKQALAVDASLSAAADNHSEDMEAQNYFSHTGLNGSTPTTRAADEGYSGGVGENIGWIGSTSTRYSDADRAESHHDNLWASPGHQQNLMNGNWEVVGIGYAEGDYVYNGTNYRGSTFVTQKFGSQPENYLTGVVIDDRDGDQFYDIGEGQGQVHVTAFNAGGVYTTETYAAGGYSLALDPGTYSVVFHGGALDGIYETEVTIGGNNVKLDVIEDGDAGDANLVTTDTVAEAITNNLTLAYSGSEDEYGGELLYEAIQSVEDGGALVDQVAPKEEPLLSIILTEPSATVSFDSTEPYEDEEPEDMIVA